MKALTILILSCLIGLQLGAQNSNSSIIPTPLKVENQKGTFNLKRLSGVSADTLNAEVKRLAFLLADSLNKSLVRPELPYGAQLEVNKELGQSGAYKLAITKKNILIEGADERGVFYGIQSLMQLVDLSEDETIPCQVIEDQPGFEWRGLHLDVARTYYPVEQIKKIMRMMAYYKLNVLHLHLTDDQAWRVEIKKYPELAERGSYGGPYSVIGSKWLGHGNGQGHGMYYKHKHIKRILEYAKSLYIDVVPEVDMPAHAAAFLVAFPELRCTSKDTLPDPHIGLFGWDYNWRTKDRAQYQWDANREVCIGKEETFEVLQGVFDELMELFPSKYIHIGGDEAYKHGWQKCAHCQKRMQEEGLDDEKKLQSYFIKRMEKHIISKGRQMIGWNEIMQGGINPSTTVMFWNGHNHDEELITEALENGNEMVMSPINNVYFDITNERRSANDVYQYEPLQYVPEKYVDQIRGIQACVWGEHGRLDSGGQVRFDAMQNFERMIFPRLLPLAELAWHKRKQVEDEVFFEQLDKHIKVLKEKGISIGEVKMVPWW
ncbi:MAG: beta-N-acetylhexosaminidase [Carboxylicivirga sp.]|jgi:hexosaminidase|nr:beta-N-acetylhexosaminidase [Carboxylicivirga sp.]